jgi:hypothetical protein
VTNATHKFTLDAQWDDKNKEQALVAAAFRRERQDRQAEARLAWEWTVKALAAAAGIVALVRATAWAAGL